MKAVILAGGSGTRLWPLSRKKTPKQFHNLVSEKSLFQETIARLNFLNNEDIYIASNVDYLDIIKREAPQIPLENIILEPALRDTASCIGFAAAYIGKKFPNEVMSIIYSDHLIKDTDEFQEKLKIAAKLAKEEKTLNIIEVKAKYANTNLGYVKINEKSKTINNVDIYNFEKFIEKPNIEKAEQMIKDPNYLWNTGYYVWRIDVILEQYKKHAPQTYKKLIEIQSALNTLEEEKTINKIYPTLEKISIDYAIMEKVDKNTVKIIPSDLGWSDIGTWESLHEEICKNPQDNIQKGKSINIDNQGCIIINRSDTITTTIGLKNIVVVNTKDAILICDKRRSQDVKKIVESLKKDDDIPSNLY